MKRFDVVVYGGTSAGVIAAVAAARLGHRVALIEPGRHLGGMTSGGLGATDFGNKRAIGGMSREFYASLGKHYGRDEAWTFEPSVAAATFQTLIKGSDVEVLLNHRIIGADKTGSRLSRIRLERVETDHANAPVAAPANAERLDVEARAFIDTSYEGDLFAAAGVSFAVGRESVSTYDEAANGIRAETPKHQFAVPVDPYVRPGDPTSGLLPLVSGRDPGKPGDGDDLVQAYNFRLCFTNNRTNRLPIDPPGDYDPKRFELLRRYLHNMEAAGHPMRLHRLVMAISRMPNDKTDINNSNAVSTDFIGESWDYPTADYATRGRIWNDHLNYTRGLIHFLQSSPDIPAVLRDEMNQWGLCRDEFTDTGGWPHQLYVREARRLVGEYVVSQADCEHVRVARDVIGLAAYTMDSHNCQRVVQNGVVRNEGNVEVRPTGPYPISYRAITPKRKECDNLLVPVCLSASHIAFGSIRMEPVFMVLAESAAIATSMAITNDCAVQEINTLDQLTDRLQQAGQVLEFIDDGSPYIGNPLPEVVS